MMMMKTVRMRVSMTLSQIKMVMRMRKMKSWRVGPTSMLRKSKLCKRKWAVWTLKQVGLKDNVNDLD